jgi:hypothetical protein
MRRFPALVLWTLAAILIPVSNAAASPSTMIRPPGGSIGVRLLDAPASERNDPRARLYIIDHLADGAVIHRRIQVVNNTRAQAHLAVYAAAATISGGSFRVAPGRTPNELTSWISTSRPAVVLAPKASAPVTVTVAVPRDAAPGERYAVVWVEATATTATGGVTEVNRVGIRAYLSVGPGGPPAAAFTIGALTAARETDGRPAVRAQVRNTGGRALDISGTLVLTDGPGGLKAGPFPVALGTTLALNDSQPVQVILDRQLPNGPWHALLDVKSGLIDRTAQATITFPEGPARRRTLSGTRPRPHCS